MRIPSLLELGIEQQKVIDLPFQGCHVITGSPGGGKTVTAVYRAWTLAVTGRDVVLITRFDLLRQHLAQLAPDLTEAVDITTYEWWVRDFWRERFETDPPRYDQDERGYDWIEMQRSCILLNVAATTTHLVIDEGQNLPLGFYQLCQVLGVDVTVFADENQCISPEHSTLSEIRRALAAEIEPLVLPNNHRNSREIALLASEFRTEPHTETALPARVGPTPVVIKVPSLDALATGIFQYFNAYRCRTIGIICRTTFLVRSIQSKLTRVGLAAQTQAYVHNDPLRHAVDFAKGRIKIVSAASIKGLEFDSVFVPDLDSYDEDPTSIDARLRFLTICTRAREDLYLAHRAPREPAILSTVPASLLTRREA
ncbi:hypothetical protein [Amycolatopsis circi]|uniref:hypothetical protein n=1 Tax=Amycolatopsis circi TaxID=871959 RepID=UPI000E225BC5|nr:hypothetical protein [Amycolatopsis circi]